MLECECQGQDSIQRMNQVIDQGGRGLEGTFGTGSDGSGKVSVRQGVCIKIFTTSGKWHETNDTDTNYTLLTKT